MNDRQQFKSVWDALEDDPIRAQNLKLRSAAMIEITEKKNEDTHALTGVWVLSLAKNEKIGVRVKCQSKLV